MTARTRSEPPPVLTDAERELRWMLRGLCHVALAALEINHIQDAEQAFRDALEAIEATK